MATVQKQITGYCPEQEDEYTITVNFIKDNHPRVGVFYRKESFKCEFVLETRKCKTCGTGFKNCPIYRSAQY